jgi:signal transduction histidine kinase
LVARILGNLVKNALEASPAGAEVTVRGEARGGHPEFTVHNPGAMPAEVQHQLFQRSFSTKGRDRGLGTYSVKLLAERYLGGRVSFESTPDRGTTFRVELP